MERYRRRLHVFVKAGNVCMYVCMCTRASLQVWRIGMMAYNSSSYNVELVLTSLEDALKNKG